MGNAFIKGLSHSADNQIHVVEPISSVKAKLKDDFGVVVSNYNDPEKQMGEIFKVMLIKNKKNNFTTGFQN